MKSNKLLFVTLVLIVLAPVIAITGQVLPKTSYIAPDDWDSSVGVVPGLTIKYTIDELVLPEGEMEGITIPDLAGNTLYVKVLSVEEDTYFDVSLTGTLIRYAVGIILATDETFTIGEGFTAIDITLPAGSASPPIALYGVPHFNTTSIPTTPFFLNNDWSEHALALQFIGMTVSNLPDSLSASLTTTDSEISGSWRKSDGILTDLRVDNVVFMDMNLTGVTLDISLDTVETKGLTISVGDEISLKANIASLDITGAGDLYSLIPQNNITAIESQVASLQDNVIIKYIVSEVEGLYYKCDVYTYDIDTQSLMKAENSYVFNGFFGSIQIVDAPLIDTQTSPLSTQMELDAAKYFPFYAPIITNDWDIYTGYMILADTIVGVYLDDVLDFVTTSALSGITFNTIDGSFEVIEKKDYKYLKESFNVDVTAEIAQSLDAYYPDVAITLDAQITAIQEGWVAYANDGFLAGARMKLDVNVEVNSDMGTAVSGLPTGTVSINLDIKLVNPDYNPPDPLGGGIIPGFTWLIALPALLGVAALGLISRKRK